MIKIDKNVSWTESENETVLINPQNQKCIILRETAKEIWEKIASLGNEKEVIRVLCEQYTSSNCKQIETDCLEFFIELEKNEFIKIC